MLMPSIALAAGPGLSDQSFEVIFALIVIGTIAFVAAHFVTDWLQRTYGIVTGVEYLVMGVIVSPGFTEWAGVGWEPLTAETVRQLSPALVLSSGCLGLLAGVNLDFRARDGISARASLVGLALTVSTLFVVSVIPFVIAAYFVGWEGMLTYVPHLLCFGAVACVANSAHLHSLIAFLDARGNAAVVATRVARTASLFAIVAFGVLFCLFKPAPTVAYGPVVDVAFWFSVHILLGLVLGLVFALFLRSEMTDDKLLTVVIGMVIFTSGIAYFLQLSPIVVCFVLGVVLANAAPRDGARVREMLQSVQQPLYIVIFIFVGASIPIGVPWWAWAAAIPWLILRRAGRSLGSLGSRSVMPELRTLPPIGAALLAPGALSAAMLLNFHEVYANQPLADETYAALLLGIVLSEPLAYQASRLWLIDATDVSATREGAG